MNAILMIVMSCTLSCNNAKREHIEATHENTNIKADTSWIINSDGNLKKCVYIEELSDEYFYVEYCLFKTSEGKKLRKGRFVNDFPSGLHYFYRSNESLEKIIDFNMLDGDSAFVNQVITFDENGDTLLEKSNFFNYELFEDTLVMGEKLNGFFNLRAKYHSEASSCRLYLKDQNGEKYHSLETNNGSRVFNVPANENTGVHVLRGYCEEVSIDSVLQEVSTRTMILPAMKYMVVKE